VPVCQVCKAEIQATWLRCPYCAQDDDNLNVKISDSVVVGDVNLNQTLSCKSCKAIGSTLLYCESCKEVSFCKECKGEIELSYRTNENLMILRKSNCPKCLDRKIREKCTAICIQCGFFYEPFTPTEVNDFCLIIAAEHHCAPCLEEKLELGYEECLRKMDDEQWISDEIDPNEIQIGIRVIPGLLDALPLSQLGKLTLLRRKFENYISKNWLL
jgi:hypothetical protein